MWALTHVKRQSMSVSAFLSPPSQVMMGIRSFSFLETMKSPPSSLCSFAFSYSCWKFYHSLHLVDFPPISTVIMLLSALPLVVLLSYPRPSKSPWECSSQAHITHLPRLSQLLTGSWLWKKFSDSSTVSCPLDSQASQQPSTVSISPSESWITSLTAKHLTSPRRPFQNWPELQISSFHSSNTPISSL